MLLTEQEEDGEEDEGERTLNLAFTPARST